jgi:hypothetical protein
MKSLLIGKTQKLLGRVSFDLGREPDFSKKKKINDGDSGLEEWLKQ